MLLPQKSLRVSRGKLCYTQRWRIPGNVESWGKRKVKNGKNWCKWGKHKIFIFSIKELILLYSRMKNVSFEKNILLRFWFWVEVFAAWAVFAVSPRQVAFLVEDGECLHMWRVFVNIFNKQSRTADKGWSCRLGLREGLKNPHHNGNHVTKCYTACMDSLEGPKERKMDMTFGTWNIRFMSVSGSSSEMLSHPIRIKKIWEVIWEIFN
jgi:hypothetical protein